jgi:hypothetical protein
MRVNYPCANVGSPNDRGKEEARTRAEEMNDPEARARLLVSAGDLAINCLFEPFKRY